MDAVKRIKIALAISGAVILFLLLIIVNSLFSQISRDSENIIVQKKEILESEARAKNLHDFKANLKQYQPNLEKIDRLFIDISEPIGFIEFLESEAALSKLSVEISPPILKEKDDDFWQSLEFSLSITGSFPGLMRFLDRLESSPYLIRIVNFSAKKDPKIDNKVTAALSIRAYAK